MPNVVLFLVNIGIKQYLVNLPAPGTCWTPIVLRMPLFSTEYPTTDTIVFPSSLPFIILKIRRTFLFLLLFIFRVIFRDVSSDWWALSISRGCWLTNICTLSPSLFWCCLTPGQDLIVSQLPRGLQAVHIFDASLLSGSLSVLNWRGFVIWVNYPINSTKNVWNQ